MYRIIWPLLLLCFAVRVPAQEVTVKLVDASGEALPGVVVKLLKSDAQPAGSSLSDVNGEARINIQAYPAQLEISNMGSIPLVRTLNAAPAGLLTISLDQKYTGLNEVVVTGVGRPTRLDEAVSVYKIITAADLRAQGAVTLQEALRNQAGINISQDGMLGGQMNMRALSGANVKIMIDGLPVNGREASNVDLGQFNMANIEKIEIVQGPMSVMYGSDAIGGVINLTTKTNKHSWNAGANAFYESIGRYNFGADLARSWEKDNLSLTFTRNFFQGWDSAGGPLPRNPDWKPKEQYIGNLKYIHRFSENTVLTYGGDLTTENLVIKDAVPDPLNEFNKTARDMYFRTTRFINRLQLRWKTGANGYWESNNSYALYHRRRTTYNTDLSTLERRLSDLPGDQSVNTFDNITSRTTYNNKAGIFNYTFGYDINAEFARGVEKIKDGNKSMGDYALFLTTDIKALPTLTLQPAIRFTHNTLYNAPISPSLSFLYKPTRALHFRGSYSRGFRAPTLKELYLDFHDSNHNIDGNPDLKAEYSNHFQASAAYTFFEKGRRSLLTSLTGFYDDVKDQIALRQLEDSGRITNRFTNSNIGHTRIIVVQLNNELRWENLRVNLGASYTKSLETITGLDTVPNFHYFEVTGNARYDIPKWGAGIAVFYKYTGPQPVIGGIEGGGLFTGRLRSYHNIDASVEKSFYKERIQLTAGVRNLANVSNLAAAGVGGGAHSGGSGLMLTTGRSVFASLRVQIGK
ncbi:TonB-dependent receptor plug domain-containing protein [Taibaiella helva]|uniref:TonB-dependent receptor plug domain-containing protein n=1 Tax=Taibaiella helva TaxID=2301235 RepID=UPI000E56FE88|nr:TonB-dependent receptor [Taibaiella helva]